MASPVKVNIVVEGNLDEIVVTKTLNQFYIQVNKVYEKGGKASILKNLRKYNAAAQSSSWPWIVVVDLDNPKNCAPPFIKKHLPQRNPRLLFRVAVMEIESWLLADRDQLAEFLAISRDLIPYHVEKEEDPKTTIINLARRSPNRDIREDLIPQKDSGAKEGPRYTTRMMQFVLKNWRPAIAARKADSLRRFIKAARTLL